MMIDNDILQRLARMEEGICIVNHTLMMSLLNTQRIIERLDKLATQESALSQAVDAETSSIDAAIAELSAIATEVQTLQKDLATAPSGADVSAQIARLGTLASNLNAAVAAAQAAGAPPAPAAPASAEQQSSSSATTEPEPAETTTAK